MTPNFSYHYEKLSSRSSFRMNGFEKSATKTLFRLRLWFLFEKVEKFVSLKAFLFWSRQKLFLNFGVYYSTD